MKKSGSIFKTWFYLFLILCVSNVHASVEVSSTSTLTNVSSQLLVGLDNPVLNSKETIALSYFNGEKWLQLGLKNTDNAILKKQIYFSGLTGFVQIFEKDQNQKLDFKQEFGSSVPYLKQPYRSVYSIADLELKPLEEKTIYFKIASRHNVNASLYIGTIDEIKDREIEESVFYYIYLGAILALVMYNFFIYIYLKDNAYLRYCIFSTSFMATLSVIKGYPDLFFANHSFSISHYLMFFSAFSVLSASGFTYYFLEAYKRSLLCQRVFKSINILAIFFMIVSLTSLEDQYPLYFGLAIDVLVLFSNIIFIVISVRSFNQMASAKFYLLSWCFVFAAIFTWFGMTFGFLPQNFLTINSLLISNIAQMITLSLAIAYRMHQLKADKIIAEEKAFQKDRYQRLVRVLSHDIANSLSVVLLQTEKLNKENSYSKDLLQATYQKIIFAGNNIKKILERVRDQEKLNSLISQELHMQVFKLDVILNEAHLIFEEKLNSKKIELLINLQSHLQVRADRVCFLNHIVCNILSNAIKFSAENSKIEIKTHTKDEKICMEFIDHGVGIAEPILSEMLKANRLVSTQGTSNEAGHGFGIPIIRDYVEFFGGTFQIHSISAEVDKNNSGTRITLLFPISEA